MGYLLFGNKFVMLAAASSRKDSGSGPIVFLLLVLVGAAILYYVLMRWFKSGTKPLWTQLASVVNGKVKMSNFTYSGTKLNGIYKGLPIVAWVDYDKRVDALSQTASHSYFFAVEAVLGTRGNDWKLDRDLFKNREWQIEADAPLQQRLYQAGTLSVAQAWPLRASAAYKARHGTLRLRMPIRNATDLPTPDSFRQQLDTLLSMAKINGQVNVN